VASPAIRFHHGNATNLGGGRTRKRATGMTQLGLFADPRDGPAGLRYAGDFIEPAVEQALIGRIAALPLQCFQFGAFEGNRRVASFGYRYDYSLQRLTEAEPIPDWVLSMARQVEAWARLASGSV